MSKEYEQAQLVHPFGMPTTESGLGTMPVRSCCACRQVITLYLGALSQSSSMALQDSSALSRVQSLLCDSYLEVGTSMSCVLLIYVF